MTHQKAEATEILRELLGPNYKEIGDFNLTWISHSKCDAISIRNVYQLLRGLGLSDRKIATNATLFGFSNETLRQNYETLRRMGLRKKQIITSPQLLGFSQKGLEKNYERLRRVGLTAKIAQHHVLLYRNPETLEQNLRFLKDRGLTEEKIIANPLLLVSNRQTIERNWRHLKSKGLTDEKISTNVHLLHLSPRTIDRNYQNLRRYFEKATIATFAPLLTIPPETINSNVQFLNFLGIDYARYPLACGSGPRKKREKIAWLVRQLFGPEHRRNDGVKKAIRRVRRLVKENPKIVIYSFVTLERMKNSLVNKVQKM